MNTLLTIKISISLTHLIITQCFVLRYFGKSRHYFTVPFNGAEKHLIRPYPHLTFTIQSLIYDHFLQSLAIFCNTQELILAAFEVSVIVCHTAKIVKTHIYLDIFCVKKVSLQVK